MFFAFLYVAGGAGGAGGVCNDLLMVYLVHINEKPPINSLLVGPTPERGGGK